MGTARLKRGSRQTLASSVVATRDFEVKGQMGTSSVGHSEVKEEDSVQVCSRDPGVHVSGDTMHCVGR